MRFAIKALMPVFIAAICLVFVACLGVKPEEDESGEVVFHDRVSLDIVLTEYSEATETLWLGEGGYVQAFNEAYPYITLNVEVLPWVGMYAELERRIEAGNEPDILNIDAYYAFTERDMLMPVTEYVSEELLSDFIPGYGDEYAIPLLSSGRGLFCNMDILNAAGISAAPTNKDELYAACEAVKAVNPEGFAMGIDISENGGQDTFAVITYANGGGYLGADGEPAIESPENNEAINMLYELRDAGYLRTYDGSGASYSMREDFLAGNLAIIIADQSFSKDAGFMNLDIKNAMTDRPGSTNPVVCDYMVVFNDSTGGDARTDAIKTFVNWLYDSEDYAYYANFEGFSPVTYSACEYMAGNNMGAASLFARLIPESKPIPTGRRDWESLRAQSISKLH